MAPIGADLPTRGQTAWDTEADAYLFQCEGVEYRVPIDGADEQCGLTRIEGRLPGGPWVTLVQEAGALLREGEGAVLPPDSAALRCEFGGVRHSLRGRILALTYAEALDGRAMQRTLEIRPQGASLALFAAMPGSPSGTGYCGYSLGPLRLAEAREVPVPGLPDSLHALAGGGFFSAFADRYLGAASAYPPGGAFYRLDADGALPPVQETFYLTLSASPLDPLPALRRPAAPYMAALATRVTLDFYSEGPYADDARLLAMLPEYGLEDVLLIYRNWQHYGFRRKLPLMYPADPSRGKSETFRRMLAAAREAGWLVALLEEYLSVAEDSPYWSRRELARWPDAAPRLNRMGLHAVAADRMLDFARLEATKIQRNYRPSAVFVDGHTAWNPEGGLRQVNAAPGSAAGTEPQAMAHVETLLGFLRELHGGPVIGSGGEGATRFDTFAEGMADAVIRGPDGGMHSPLIVDYELCEVRPKLLGLGAGSYRQFCGHPAGAPVEASQVDWDAYRATEIALGHAGYVSNYRVKPGLRGVPYPGGSATTMAREYFLLRALQELYLGTPVKTIAYRDQDRMLSLAEALTAGVDLTHAQIFLEYANGLMIWVNRSRREPWDVGPEDARHQLPPLGFLATAPQQNFTAYSALVAANRVDFCRSAAYSFLDVRGGAARTVEGITTDGAAAILKTSPSSRPDVVLIGARQVALGEEEYCASERADVRFRHISAREIEITVMDSLTGKPIHVAWPSVTDAWRPDRIEVREKTEAGWKASLCPVQPTRGGPQLSRACPGTTYRLTVPG